MSKDTTLDRIDCEIVAAMQNNARLTNKELAAQVGLAPSSCLSRVKKLVDHDVLRGFHADVDPGALGIGLEAMITIRLSQHSRELYKALRAHVLSLPEGLHAYHISGADDFLVHVAVRDTKHLHDLIIDSFASREEVTNIETALIFEHVRSPMSPNYIDSAK